MTLNSDGVNFDGSIPAGQPFSTTWNPVSYRAAVTIEPVRNLMFYGMTATAYDPRSRWHLLGQPQELAGIDQRPHLRGRCQATVLGQQGGVDTCPLTTSRGETSMCRSIPRPSNWPVKSRRKGIEFAAAVRPVDGLKLWGNVALTQAAL